MLQAPDGISQEFFYVMNFVCAFNFIVLKKYTGNNLLNLSGKKIWALF